MRRYLLLLVLVACHKKTATPNQVTAAKLPIPTVNVADDLAPPPAGPPPVLVFVDAAGKLSIAAPPSAWGGLGSVDVTKGKPIDLEALDKLLRIGKGEKWTPKQIVEHVGKPDDLDAVAADTTADSDDPPPPPEEDSPDESGGTGTAMSIDRKPEPPKDPRAAHVEAAGGFRVSVFAALGGGTGTVAGGFGSDSGYGPGAAMPERAAGIGGEALKGEAMPVQPAVLFIDPHAKVKSLLDTVAFTQGAIAVAHEGKVGLLRLNFAVERNESMSQDPPWIEVRALPGGQLELEAVPGKPVTLDKTDAIKGALPKLVTDAKLDPWNPVDILVPPDTDVQHVIDLVVAVDQGGAHSVGIGTTPDAAQLSLRGHVTRRFVLGVPNVQGDLDKAILRRYFKRGIDDLRACYDKALESNATLKGTIVVTLMIDKKGAPKNVTTDGDPSLGPCMAAVVKKMEFPPPKSGTVDVAYPVSFAPTQR